MRGTGILPLLLLLQGVRNGTALSSMPISDCAVIGVGVLGTLVCRDLLQSDHPPVITGITRTETHHAAIRAQVASPNEERFRLVTADTPIPEKFRHVLFCAPPSGFDDYPRALQEAMDRYWLGPPGRWVFTSSGAVYGDTPHDVVTEATPPVDRTSARQERLLRAEAVVRQAGGCCLRLAGLYNLHRGPHHYYFTKFAGQTIDAPAHGRLNLLHYEDAAAACVAALRLAPSAQEEEPQSIFLISDGQVIKRHELLHAAGQAAVYRDVPMPQCAKSTAPTGKIYDGSVSNAILQWTPKYPSFPAFMAAHAGE
jgi:nucleoside-diphosphate-sugar epimerase